MFSHRRCTTPRCILMGLSGALDGKHGRLHGVADWHNMCMHACMHACIHTYIHTYIQMHICCIHASMCVCSYACMHVCMYVCMLPCIYPSTHPSIILPSSFYRTHSIHPSTGVTIWGNHSSTQYPDVSFSTVKTDAGSKQVPYALWQPVVCKIHTIRPDERMAQTKLSHS